jgi:hypothetical protein
MELPILWKQNLQNNNDKKEIIIEMIGQIKKDFAMFSENIQFTEKAEEKYEDLFKQLEHYLNDRFSSNTERLYPILYRIDILEKDIQFAINQQDAFNFIASITEQIIMKELQKVLIRRHYRDKK